MLEGEIIQYVLSRKRIFTYFDIRLSAVEESYGNVILMVLLNSRTLKEILASKAVLKVYFILFSDLSL